MAAVSIERRVIYAPCEFVVAEGVEKGRERGRKRGSTEQPTERMKAVELPDQIFRFNELEC